MNSVTVEPDSALDLTTATSRGTASIAFARSGAQYLCSGSLCVSAIAREKQIKGCVRVKKASMIESMNPNWLDLSAEWRQRGGASLRSA